MKRLLAITLITMMLLGACASDPYDSEGIVNQGALDAIKINRDCADLQSTFDLNWRRSLVIEAGTLKHKQAIKFVTASDARMEEVGC
jgi:hypothetical protein